MGGRSGDLFGDELFTGRPPKPGKSSHDKRRSLATVRRGACSPRGNHLRGIGEKGEGIRQIRQRPESQGDEKGSEVPGMRRQAVARREKEGRRPSLCLPKVRQKVLRRQRNLPGFVEDDDANDRENDNADYAGLPELGGFLDTRNRSENRSVLEGPMLGRQPKMVSGIDAFQTRLDRRDALCPDESERLGGWGLEHLCRQNSQRRLPRSRLRFQRKRVLSALRRETRHPDEGHGRRSSERKDRERIQADPRRGACPQSPGEEIRARGRLVQIRARRQGIRIQNEADEQLLQLPQAFLRIPRRDQIHQAGSLCEFLFVPVVARQKVRP